jgi:3-hydroxyacyl-[acyl-carrier-protein] dehydratase
MSEHRYTGCVPADHPSLPGHFPGNPIVPAVMLLQEVEQALRQAVGASARIARLPNVKFLHPLLPGQMFEVALTLDAAAGTALFQCHAGGVTLSSGRLEYRHDG